MQHTYDQQRYKQLVEVKASIYEASTDTQQTASILYKLLTMVTETKMKMTHIQYLNQYSFKSAPITTQ
jgi:type IV secretory pathway component VirB8